MSAISIMSIIFGIIIILGRAPLLFEPEATLLLVRRIINKKSALRIVGVFTAVLGLALVASAWNVRQSLALILYWIGWALFFAGIAELIFTAFVQRLANAVWSMGNTTARILGVFAVIIGTFFIYLGVAVLR
jgi:uncharacterized protein YjeT (DUF2065 family)